MKTKMPAVLKGMLIAISGMLVVIAGLIASYKTAPPADLSLGAVSGNEVQGSEFIVGGEHEFYNSVSVKQGTTTICAVRSPGATSSPRVRVQLTVGTSTASTIVAASAATAYATTTELGRRSFAATQGGSLVASTTYTVLPPNQFVVVSMEGGTTVAGGGGGSVLGTSPIGTCDIDFWQF